MATPHTDALASDSAVLFACYFGLLFLFLLIAVAVDDHRDRCARWRDVRRRRRERHSRRCAQELAAVVRARRERAIMAAIATAEGQCARRAAPAAVEVHTLRCGPVAFSWPQHLN